MFKLLDDEKTLRYFEKEKDKGVEISKLESGIYDIRVNLGAMFSLQTLNLKHHILKEKLIEPTSDKYKKIYASCIEVFNPVTKEIYSDMGILNKLGVMLYGKPGTGKTCMAKVIIQKVCTEFDAICLIGDPNLMYDNVIDSIRLDDPNRNIIIFLDEMDKAVGNSYVTKMDLLSLLDGNRSRANLLTIACLNDYVGLSHEFKNRPSRFKISEHIDFCDESLVDNYIRNKIPKKYLEKINIAEISYKISETKITIDQVKSILVDHIAYGTTIDALLASYTKVEEVNTSETDI